MFSAVYVCKETVEHVLLSAGEAGHHHHADDESASTGLELPLTLIFITLFSLLGSALLFDNNSEILNITQMHYFVPFAHSFHVRIYKTIMEHPLRLDLV